MNRPFLPLLQMSESETLISMVNRMVESSSPRAQIFMQVRPPPGSMVPVSTISAACAWSSQAIWARVCSALPAHLPGLISWAPPCLPPLIPLCLLHSSRSWVNPRPVSQTINTAGTDIPYHASDRKSAFSSPGLLFHVGYLLHRHLRGSGHKGCDMEPSDAPVV